MEYLLKLKKIRKTPFRIEVLAILIAHKKPISIEELERKIVKFDRITLYRTIKIFIDKGVIHEVLIQGESKKIALCSSKCKEEAHIHHLEHLHFFCIKCNDTYCVDEVEVPEIKIPEHQILSFEIQVKGICKNCK